MTLTKKEKITIAFCCNVLDREHNKFYDILELLKKNNVDKKVVDDFIGMKSCYNHLGLCNEIAEILNIKGKSTKDYLNGMEELINPQ